MAHCNLTTAPAVDVFNLPLYECYLVVDIRSIEEHNAGHIVSSISFPSPKSDADEV